MKLQQLLDQHGMQRNPFAEEDAQIDLVFKEHCIDSTYHPTWDKVYGDPGEPSTAIVFGEKGSGKTAMRLQVDRHLRQYNQSHPDERLFVIHYEDLNPFLDRFRERLGRRGKRADKVLAQWRLWDHMDAILSLGVTSLVDRVLETRGASAEAESAVRVEQVEGLDRHQARDLLLLAAYYDQSTAETFRGRCHRLRQRLRFHHWRTSWDIPFGALWSTAVLAVVVVLAVRNLNAWLSPAWLAFYLVLAAAGWTAYLWRWWSRHLLARRVRRHMRVGNHDTGALRGALMHLSKAELDGQPAPVKQSTDDRYELLLKLQAILRTLGFAGVIVLVDRVDEPHLVNGSAELMKMLLWPMLDNKFLKHPGLGIKLMLPIELTRFIDREDRAFYQRARLDKQNMVPSFEWTGEALYDLTEARIAACAKPGASPSLRDLFDPSVSDQRLIEAFRHLRVPRHLFKFLYRLLVAHCNAHTEKAPVWQIDAQRFESVLAVQLRDQDAFDRGVAAG